MEAGRGSPDGSARRRLAPEARWAIEAVVALGIVTATTWLGTRYVATPFTVAGPSMEPTLSHGDRVVVDLWSYRRRPPRPGEVALVAGPGNTPLVKRIVEAGYGPAGSPPVALDPGDRSSPRLWVLGDNLAESADSRLFGPVPAGRVRGRVVFRYWPLTKLGRIS